MRPYLAIIKDSFREAMASWVLWILLGAITLFLLILAPAGFNQKLTTKFTIVDLRDPPAFVDALKAAAEKPESSPAKLVWSSIDEKRRTDLVKAREALDREEPGDAFFRITGILVNALNELLTKEDLYDPEKWKDTPLDKELREYADRGFDALENEERLRFNRVLLELTFPDQFMPTPQKSIAVTYLVWETPAVPLQQSSVKQFIEEVVLSNFMSWIVGNVAILVAVVVTAPIIPQMFEPGSLHLLLSKPVNRTLLFLSKFFGGCAFTLLNVGYLLAGLWLILGLRFGIWNIGILYCIPVFLFLFTIYYAVSAWASVIWRNAIVSVVVTVVFWAACFSVGFLKLNFFDPFFIQPQRIVKLIPAGDSLISVNESGDVSQWVEEERDWQKIFQSADARGRVPMFVGPLYDAKHDQLVGANTIPLGMNLVPVQIVTGKRSEGWRRRPGVGMPAGTIDMFVEPESNRKPQEKDQPGLLVVSTRGFYRFADVAPRKILGVEVSFGSGPQMVPVGADPELFFNTPAAAALDPISGRIAVYSRGTLSLYQANSQGKYAEKLSAKLEGNEDSPVILAFSGASIFLARESGSIEVIDPETLTVTEKLQAERSSQPRFLAAALGGKRCAIVFQNGKLWLLDVEAKSLRRANVTGQGDIYAAVFKSPGRLLVADRSTRVSEYASESLKRESRIAPNLTMVERVYRYCINPLYTIFPKPGEFGRTVQYVLTGKETTNYGMFADNMQMARTRLNPWRPVWNGLIFMVIMLGLACVYIERQEF